jgi:hypothetical protein
MVTVDKFVYSYGGQLESWHYLGHHTHLIINLVRSTFRKLLSFVLFLHLYISCKCLWINKSLSLLCSSFRSSRKIGILPVYAERTTHAHTFLLAEYKENIIKIQLINSLFNLNIAEV